MVYAEWTPKQRATHYTIAYGDGVTVSTNKTFHTITGLERAQNYDITVTAFSASKSEISSITCSGETGEDNSIAIEDFAVPVRFIVMDKLS